MLFKHGMIRSLSPKEHIDLIGRCLIFCAIIPLCSFNTLRPRQKDRHFPDDTLKYIFFNDNAWILNKISLKFVRKGPIDKNPALVQIMAWRQTGDKPLFEPYDHLISTMALPILVRQHLYIKNIPRVCLIPLHNLAAQDFISMCVRISVLIFQANGNLEQSYKIICFSVDSSHTTNKDADRHWLR